ncbi:MAG: outer membrane lipoprotein-sorting protein [Verrucomicrobia bacterium]|nr:outer membrane lipoprotein-sorting protein [Verrucomicrobiota bacterium]
MSSKQSTAGRILGATLASLAILSTLTAAQPTEGRQVISDPATQRVEGQRIAAEARALAPKASSTNTATLRLFGSNRKLRAEIPVTIRTTVADDQWHTDYTSGDGLRFRVMRSHNTPSRYAVGRETGALQPAANLLVPFAGSDFWLVDLGLDFFHWPEQRLLSKEQRRSEACFVIESVTAKPAPGGYSRVVTWLDQGTLGIVAAEAYDTRGKLLKEFQPKSFKKVNGQWQLKEMEIRNEQTDSRTSLVFDVEVQ